MPRKHVKDDWDKPRSNGMRLSDAEREILRKAHHAGRTTRDVAKELKCATRTVQVYYARIEGRTEAPRRNRHMKPVAKPSPRSIPKPNYYHSNFEPS